jgi:SAM-dependent methyltransferase
MSTAAAAPPAPPGVAEAFDRAALDYDAGFGRNAVGLLFRHVFQERLRRLFAPGARVLDIGCGTGDDALFLAGLGVRVFGIDAAPGMIARARAKLAASGAAAGAVRFEVRAAEDVAGLDAGAHDASFDGALSNFGALNCAELGAVGRGLAARLRPGAPVVLSLMGRWPLPELVAGALRGRGLPRGGEPRVAGVPVPARYPTLDEARRQLGPAFRWRDAWALGVLLPPPGRVGWVHERPQVFGMLAALERLVRRWPLVRGLGDHVVLEGERR